MNPFVHMHLVRRGGEKPRAYVISGSVGSPKAANKIHWLNFAFRSSPTCGDWDHPARTHRVSTCTYCEPSSGGDCRDRVVFLRASNSLARCTGRITRRDGMTIVFWARDRRAASSTIQCCFLRLGSTFDALLACNCYVLRLESMDSMDDSAWKKYLRRVNPCIGIIV
ncbi:hypothetical protein BDN70DRAFT_667530 [Pholiota conissans]|uniref:Uncharacterized protein n=1 Tax=Pholiota conissans TaxID=109636 RepID=A0A9P6D0W7_9AGAR|nr:hypothetical protein BDN70DRAFT_667530 [Pholiota conissans]